ncbi:gamma-glutamylcyclotransferase [Streptomyces inusitatus]|uniref:Gamma-glutamylcyclotransferase n=1 Tax=Streptomyces inusitatus TaxID=68221 RepID=A0A918UR48_9ACTN|nr:gamma-glutamylcyclotransferase family protein [Streptomyces inusitatus]GGZ28219.1 gamma-glutamylcyclotransferase [Streptomyces inusitatus]
MNGPELPFFVYGTLRPGEQNHTLLLLGRTAAEEPARWTGAVLYEGPGYPYAVEPGGTSGTSGADGMDGTGGAGGTEPSADRGAVVVGELLTAAPGEYGPLLAELDELEEYIAPGHPRNRYERVTRDVLRAADGAAIRAWVYLAAPALARELRRNGTPVPGGDWRARPVG